MISERVLKYIEGKAANANIDLPENFSDILKKYCDVTKNFGFRLSFREGRGNSADVLGCNSGYTKYMPIVATPEWAAILVLNASEESENAFLMTLGHEITHKEKDLSPLIGFLVAAFCLTNPANGLRFVAHVNEVHADFGAIEKFADGNKNKQLAAMRFKQSLKDNINKDSLSHPSWNNRIRYVQNYDFGEALIYEIAKDTKCKCHKLIALAIKHYGV